MLHGLMGECWQGQATNQPSKVNESALHRSLPDAVCADIFLVRAGWKRDLSRKQGNMRPVSRNAPAISHFSIIPAGEEHRQPSEWKLIY